MRNLLHATVALSALLVTSLTANAADVYARPRRYAPPPPPPVYAPPPLWTGFYIGGNIGAAWANRDVRDPFLDVNFNNGNSNGTFIGGGQLGYNWQFGYAVLGIEADFMGFRITTTAAPYSFRVSETSRSPLTIGGSRPWLRGLA